MGYEVRLYLVERTEVPSEKDGAAWCSVVAMIDLCKPGYHSEIGGLDARRPDKPEVFIYGSDGNTAITKDCYDKPLGIYDPVEFLAAIKKDNEGNSYRRFDLAIAVLEAAIPKFNRLAVLTYGY